jgi:hypothetical protein
MNTYVATIRREVAAARARGRKETYALALQQAIVYVGPFKHRERQALFLTIILVLAASPLVWMHYFALLLVPLALERPRISLLWWLPLLMWICPATGRVDSWQEALVWLVTGTVLLSTTVTSRG